jgi:FkbM family methyltransferase
MALTKLTSKFSELRQHPGYRRNPPLVLWRAAAWAAHCLLRLPARAKFRRWDFRLYLPPKWRGGGCTSPYLFREEYEPEVKLLERYLNSGMTFIDGGANTGVFTFTAAHLVGPTGRVVAFEPGDSCFAALTQSVKLNDANHVTVRQQAISDRIGTARFYHHSGQENSFSLGGAKDVNFEEVETTTLDTVAAELNLDRVDFIKLDVEGAEELVFRGGLDILTKHRPLLLFEVNPEAAARLSLDTEGACHVLSELNYKFFRMADDGRLLNVAAADEFGNLLAIPAEKTAQLGIPTAATEQLSIAS